MVGATREVAVEPEGSVAAGWSVAAAQSQPLRLARKVSVLPLAPRQVCWRRGRLRCSLWPVNGVQSLLLTTHYPLPTTHYSLLTTHHSLLTTHYSLPTTHYPLPTTHYPLPTTHYSLLTTCSRKCHAHESTCMRELALQHSSKEEDHYGIRTKNSDAHACIRPDREGLVD